MDDTFSMLGSALPELEDTVSAEAIAEIVLLPSPETEAHPKAETCTLQTTEETCTLQTTEETCTLQTTEYAVLNTVDGHRSRLVRLSEMTRDFRKLCPRCVDTILCSRSSDLSVITKEVYEWTKATLNEIWKRRHKASVAEVLCGLLCELRNS